MQCKQCGQPVKDGARFCFKCGTPVAASAPAAPHGAARLPSRPRVQHDPEATLVVSPEMRESLASAAQKGAGAQQRAIPPVRPGPHKPRVAPDPDATIIVTPPSPAGRRPVQPDPEATIVVQSSLRHGHPEHHSPSPAPAEAARASRRTPLLITALVLAAAGSYFLLKEPVSKRLAMAGTPAAVAVDPALHARSAAPAAAVVSPDTPKSDTPVSTARDAMPPGPSDPAETGRSATPQQAARASKTAPAPGEPWLVEMRDELEKCGKEGFLRGGVCTERVRMKYCSPKRWNTVEECKVAQTPAPTF